MSKIVGNAAISFPLNLMSHDILKLWKGSEFYRDDDIMKRKKWFEQLKTVNH